jgi:hypothetical protein
MSRSLASVEQLFARIERHPRRMPFRCGGLNFECALPATYHVRAAYDPQFGYPREVTFLRTRHPDWLNAQFWHWFWTSGAWQHCTNLLCTSTSMVTVQVTDVTPLE